MIKRVNRTPYVLNADLPPFSRYISKANYLISRIGVRLHILWSIVQFHSVKYARDHSIAQMKIIDRNGLIIVFILIRCRLSHIQCMFRLIQLEIE